MALYTINKQSIAFKLSQAIGKRDKDLINKLNVRLQRQKDSLLDSIFNHPISQEIMDGPNAKSRYLKYGNLFSFLGFNDGDDPVGEVINFIDSKVKITNAKVKKVNLFVLTTLEYSIKAPKLSDLEVVTPLEWDKQKSWLRAVEVTGLDNFAHYLYREGKTLNGSRSGPAIQIKQQLRNTQNFAPQPYILNEIEKFLNRIKK